jgi:hypothetical protein
MSTEEKNMNVATQIEPAEPVTAKLEEAETPLAGFHEDADDELPPGWLVVSDGEQIVVPHPEGTDKKEIVERFFKAKSKKQGAFQLGLYVFDPEDVTTFGWSEDIHFPEMEKFDGLQERIEALADAMVGLTHQAAALQEAHAVLIQSEMDEDDEDDEDEGSPLSPEVLEANEPIPPARPVKTSQRGGFRPPGA